MTRRSSWGKGELSLALRKAGFLPGTSFASSGVKRKGTGLFLNVLMRISLLSYSSKVRGFLTCVERTAPVFFLGVVLSASAQEIHSPHWSYEGATGPDHWGELSPAFSGCKTGHRQSPIDITNPITSDLSPISFDYKPAKLRVVDSGHTIQVNYPPGSYITVQGHRYELVQFHFHHPSEEQINGHGYDLVIHLVHQDAEQRKAVVAVLVSQGDTNPAIAEITAHLPRSQGTEVSTTTIVNARDLLPKDRGYFTFEGSLTTPPCTEGVRWIVLKNPVTVSQSELEQFTARYPHNARPIQPLNGRKVVASR